MITEPKPNTGKDYSCSQERFIVDCVTRIVHRITPIEAGYPLNYLMKTK